VRTVLNRFGFCALIVAAGGQAAGSAVIAARVVPAASFGPADVIVRLQITPDPRNRLVSVVVDSNDFYASSVMELPGERAARSRDVRFRTVPKGEYIVRVTLLGIDGERGYVECGLALW
jgi:hypothetical protein